MVNFPQLSLSVTDTKTKKRDKVRPKRKAKKKKKLKILTLFHLDSFSLPLMSRKSVTRSAVTGPCCEAACRSDPEFCKTLPSFHREKKRLRVLDTFSKSYMLVIKMCI